MDYIPQLTSGYYPEDAGWTSGPAGENILLLYIPQLNSLSTFQVKSYDYAWLYNQELDAYIFCFKLNKQFEHAVIFKREHAGILLQEDNASAPFTVAITHKSFETLNDHDPVFMLKDILITKSQKAGW